MDAKKYVESFQAKTQAAFVKAGSSLVGHTVGRYVVAAVELGQPITRAGLELWLRLEAARGGVDKPLFEAALTWLASAPPEPSSSTEVSKTR